MIGGLSGGWVPLRRVTDDAEGWLIRSDLNVLDVVRVSKLRQQALLLGLVDHVDHCLDGSCALVLIETELEVHSHHSELVALVAKDEVKWRLIRLSGWLENLEEALRVSKDILGPNESLHGSVHTLDGNFCGECSACTFAIRELLSCANRSPWDVMRYNHADGAFNLLRSGAHHCSISDG